MTTIGLNKLENTLMINVILIRSKTKPFLSKQKLFKLNVYPSNTNFDPLPYLLYQTPNIAQGLNLLLFK